MSTISRTIEKTIKGSGVKSPEALRAWLRGNELAIEYLFETLVAKGVVAIDADGSLRVRDKEEGSGRGSHVFKGPWKESWPDRDELLSCLGDGAPLVQVRKTLGGGAGYWPVIAALKRLEHDGAVRKEGVNYVRVSGEDQDEKPVAIVAGKKKKLTVDYAAVLASCWRIGAPWPVEAVRSDLAASPDKWQFNPGMLEGVIADLKKEGHLQETPPVPATRVVDLGLEP